MKFSSLSKNPSRQGLGQSSSAILCDPGVYLRISEREDRVVCLKQPSLDTISPGSSLCKHGVTSAWHSFYLWDALNSTCYFSVAYRTMCLRDQQDKGREKSIYENWRHRLDQVSECKSAAFPPRREVRGRIHTEDYFQSAHEDRVTR